MPRYIGQHLEDIVEQQQQEQEILIKSLEKFPKEETENSALFTHNQPKSSSHDHPPNAPSGYEIATVDFARVRVPFLIAAWILFASLAKIGERRKQTSRKGEN